MNGSEMLWLEIRVPQDTKLDRANLESVVNYAFNSGSTFEFIVASTPSPERDLDRNVVRWFFGFPDEYTRSVVRTLLETQGFYVVNGSSPSREPKKGCPPDLERSYPGVAKLEATDHFAYGFLPRAGEPEEERTFEDCPPVADRLASAISRGGALRAVVERDDGAVTEAIHVARGESKAEGGPPVDGLVDGLFRSIVTFGSEGGGRETGSQPSGERPISELEQKMRNRANTGLFSLDVSLYGTPEQVNSVIHSLPFSPISLQVHESGPTRGENKMQPKLETGTKRWRRTAKKWFHVVLPIALAFGLWHTGLWTPLETFKSLANFLPLIAVVISGILPVFIRFKEPVALSHDELTLFLSLPQEMSRVPHEPGTKAEPTVPEKSSEGEGENVGNHS